MRSEPHYSRNCIRTATVPNNILFNIDGREGRKGNRITKKQNQLPEGTKLAADLGV